MKPAQEKAERVLEADAQVILTRYVSDYEIKRNLIEFAYNFVCADSATLAKNGEPAAFVEETFGGGLW